MNDKERILTTIIRGLYFTFGLDSVNRDLTGYVSFEHNGFNGMPKVGDLVMCKTSGIHDFTVGFVEEVIDTAWHGCVIREIGTNRVCKIGNESFATIKGLSSMELLEDKEYRFYFKVLKAFRRLDDFVHKFGYIEFPGKNIVKIWVRERYGGMLTIPSGPYKIEFKYTMKMSIKKIAETMVEHGFGKEKFPEAQWIKDLRDRKFKFYKGFKIIEVQDMAIKTITNDIYTFSRINPEKLS